MDKIRNNNETFLSGKYHQKSFKNVILITFDAFNFELFINNVNSLPNLKKLKENGVFFNNAFSVGPITTFAFPSILGSIYPYGYGIKIDKNIKTIDYILNKIGYNTAFINEAQAFLTPYYGYGRYNNYSKYFLNFSHKKIDRERSNIFLKGKNISNMKKNKLSLSSHLQDNIRSHFRERAQINIIYHIIYNSIKFLYFYLFKKFETYEERKSLHNLFINEIKNFINKKFKQPQFLWIHTIVNHLPYLPPNTLKFSEKKINYLNYRGLSKLVNYYCAKNLKSLFIESFKTTDKLIENIILNLEKNKYLQNSIIIVTADHGEEFMEKGYYGHNINSSSDILLKVPLIFYSPKNFKNKIISAPISTIDILPTITDLLNINKPDTAQGISLKNLLIKDLPEKNEEEKFWFRPIYSESWITKNLFDRSPGYKSKKRIFTIRLNKFKLKVRQTIMNNNIINNEYLLTNWVTNKKLEIKDNYALFTELKNLLSKHLSEQIMFSRVREN